MPEFSIIILTFNTFKLIRSCLDSVFGQYYQDFEVIVVDNGSRDGTVGFIKENYPRVNLIENRKNQGACRGRNQGIEIAKGKWVLTLDCDVILEKVFLYRILNKTKNLSAEVGMIQPKILMADRKTIYSVGIFLSSFRRFYDLGKNKIDNGQFNSSKYIFGVCSAAAIYKREMLTDINEDTGYFDERFFFLVEDVDLAWRAQRRNWKAIFCPEAFCYHNSNSSNTNKKLRQYICYRNRIKMILKNDSILFMLYYMPIYDLPRLLYLMFTNSYIWKALKDLHLRHRGYRI